MNQGNGPDHAADLLACLGGLEGCYTALAELVDRRIEAMRAGDVQAMNQWTHQEQQVAARIGQQESLRRSLTERIARSFGMSPLRARRLTLRELAGKLPETRRPELLAAADRLKRIAQRVAGRHRIAAAISREMLNHLSVALTVMTASGGASGYCPSGSSPATAPSRLFEAVG